jgi:hypothetical protein
MNIERVKYLREWLNVSIDEEPLDDLLSLLSAEESRLTAKPDSAFPIGVDLAPSPSAEFMAAVDGLVEKSRLLYEYGPSSGYTTWATFGGALSAVESARAKMKGE